jgi:hypothetical protein
MHDVRMSSCQYVPHNDTCTATRFTAWRKGTSCVTIRLLIVICSCGVTVPRTVMQRFISPVDSCMVEFLGAIEKTPNCSILVSAFYALHWLNKVTVCLDEADE